MEPANGTGIFYVDLYAETALKGYADKKPFEILEAAKAGALPVARMFTLDGDPYNAHIAFGLFGYVTLTGALAVIDDVNVLKYNIKEDGTWERD